MPPSHGDLQRQIKEKEKELLQLYEKQHAVQSRDNLASTEVASPARGHKGKPLLPTRIARRRAELRIRDSPVAAIQTEIRSPESVALSLTNEKHCVSFHKGQQQTHNAGEGLQKTPAKIFRTSIPGSGSDVHTEFAARLRRLSRMAASHGEEKLSASQIMLAFSPIPVVSRTSDLSLSVVHTPDVTLFREDQLRNSRGDSDGEARHVRFSSCSPRVSRYSVERSCPRNPCPDSSFATLDGLSPFVRSPFANSLDGEAGVTVHVDPESMGVLSPKTKELDRSADFDAGTPPAKDEDPRTPLVSRISTVLSPRASVDSYLDIINTLRSSLLETKALPCQLADLAPQRHAGIKRDRDNTPTPPLANTSSDDNTDAATPTREERVVAAKREEGSAPTNLHDAAVTKASSQNAKTALPAKAGLRFDRRSKDAEDVTKDLEALLDTFCARPRRSQRTRDGSAVSHDVSDLSAGEVLALEKKVAPSHSTGKQKENKKAFPRENKKILEKEEKQLISMKSSPASSSTEKKMLTKTVRFQVPPEQPEEKADPPTTGRRRGSKARRAPSVSCAPTKMPPSMPVEQQGLNAGILLAYGPTLFFD